VLALQGSIDRAAVEALKRYFCEATFLFRITTTDITVDAGKPDLFEVTALWASVRLR
jgi:hypothetical protein